MFFPILAVIAMVLSIVVPVAFIKLFIDSSTDQTNHPPAPLNREKPQPVAFFYDHEDGGEGGFNHVITSSCLSCNPIGDSSCMGMDWASTSDWMTDSSYSYMEGNIFHSDD